MAQPSVSRRAVLAGIAGSGVLFAASRAHAAAPPGGDGDVDGDWSPGMGADGLGAVPLDSLGVVTTSASPREPGVLYITRCMYDFIPFSSLSQRAWGGFGLYTAGSSSDLRASVDLPAGAVLHDVEWYVYNKSGAAVTASLNLWKAGEGSLAPFDGTPIPTGGVGVATVRSTPSGPNIGPHPSGVVIVGSVSTPVSATVQVNGFRLGYTVPASATSPGFHPIAPQRVYDSRHGDGPMTPNTSRTVSVANGLDAGGAVVSPDAVPAGATTIVCNVTVSGPNGPNYLSVVPGGSTSFTTSTINFPGGFDAANGTTVLIAADRTVTIFCGDQSGSTNVIVDVTGYYV